MDDAVSAVANLADCAVTRLWPDATEVEKAKLNQLIQGIQNDFLLLAGHIDPHKLHSHQSSVFVSGWRPFVGWVCGAALAYAALIEPVARFIAVVVFAYTGAIPVINTDISLQILLGLLGLAGMRTFEKQANIARNH